MNRQQLQRGPWLQHEINQLMTLVATYGTNWHLISSILTTRSAQDCRIKYYEILNIPRLRYPQNHPPPIAPVIPANPRFSINFLLNRDLRMELSHILNPSTPYSPNQQTQS